MDIKLIVKYLAGQAEQEEIRRVDEWIATNDANRTEFQRIQKLWNKSTHIAEFAAIDVEADWQKVKARMNFTSRQATIALLRRRESYTPMRYMLRIAAMLVLCVGIGAGVLWYRSSLNRVMSITTRAHEKMTITLPDGSTIHLNAATQLDYQSKQFLEDRTLVLNGEAYFDVTHDEAHPFRIRTQQVTTQVLGTSFNVRTDSLCNCVQVTVVSGKVAVFQSDHHDNRIELVKGEYGEFKNDSSQFVKSQSYDANLLAWKTGVLVFNNTPLADVISTLERVYNVHIKIDNPKLNARRFTSQFKDQSISQIIEEISIVLHCSYTIKDPVTIIIN
ncbi:FecR domain-containing protein [candidate division KSB1 bacterium]|nr:FecR domain-containing protein [candidate division KSB1 bacterium]